MMRFSRFPVRMIVFAVAGLLVAAALGAAASNLTTRPVGISAEAVSVGEELVAKDKSRNHGRQQRRRQAQQDRRHRPGGATAEATVEDPQPAPSAGPEDSQGSPSQGSPSQGSPSPETAELDDEGDLEPPEDEGEDRDDD